MVNVLVATRQTQGLVVTDVNDCVDGELVAVTPICGRPMPAGTYCTCEDEFTGLSSHGHTTTAVVHKLRGVTRAAVLALLREALCDDCYPPKDRPRAAAELLRFAAAFPVGTIVERTPRGVQARFCAEHQHDWDQVGWGILEPKRRRRST